MPSSDDWLLAWKIEMQWKHENKREKCCTFRCVCLRRKLMLDSTSSSHSLRSLVPPLTAIIFIAKRCATCMHYVITCICFVNYCCSKEIYIISCFNFFSSFWKREKKVFVQLPVVHFHYYFEMGCDNSCFHFVYSILFCRITPKLKVYNKRIHKMEST